MPHERSCPIRDQPTHEGGQMLARMSAQGAALFQFR
jgi:hypothetical protein